MPRKKLSQKKSAIPPAQGTGKSNPSRRHKIYKSRLSVSPFPAKPAKIIYLLRYPINAQNKLRNRKSVPLLNRLINKSPGSLQKTPSYSLLRETEGVFSLSRSFVTSKRADYPQNARYYLPPYPFRNNSISRLSAKKN